MTLVTKKSTFALKLEIAYLEIFKYPEVSFDYSYFFGQIIEGPHVDFSKYVSFIP